MCAIFVQRAALQETQINNSYATYIDIIVIINTNKMTAPIIIHCCSNAFANITLMLHQLKDRHHRNHHSYLDDMVDIQLHNPQCHVTL